MTALDEKMLTRREVPAPDADLLEPNYAESVRRFNARLRDANRWRWIRHYDLMAELHGKLSVDYQQRAEALMRAREESGASLLPEPGRQEAACNTIKELRAEQTEGRIR